MQKTTWLGVNSNHLDFTEECFQTSLHVKSQKIFPVEVVNYLAIIICLNVVEMTEKNIKVDRINFIQSASRLN